MNILYIGPGMSMGSIVVLVGLLVAIAFVLYAFVILPLISKNKKSGKKATKSEIQSSDVEFNEFEQELMAEFDNMHDKRYYMDLLVTAAKKAVETGQYSAVKENIELAVKLKAEVEAEENEKRTLYFSKTQSQATGN